MHSGVHGNLVLQNSTYTLGAKDQSQSTMYDTLSSAFDMLHQSKTAVNSGTGIL
jgi:hypothetical protein